MWSNVPNFIDRTDGKVYLIHLFLRKFDLHRLRLNRIAA